MITLGTTVDKVLMFPQRQRSFMTDRLTQNRRSARRSCSTAGENYQITDGDGSDELVVNRRLLTTQILPRTVNIDCDFVHWVCRIMQAGGRHLRPAAHMCS